MTASTGRVARFQGQIKQLRFVTVSSGNYQVGSASKLVQRLI